MKESQEFWPVDVADGEPDLFVCMSCLNEVFLGKVPMPACPTCQAVSTYEAFTLESIQDWGTDELIRKAQAAQQASTPASSTDIPIANT